MIQLTRFNPERRLNLSKAEQPGLAIRNRKPQPFRNA
jgi:hypothetical protein